VPSDMIRSKDDGSGKKENDPPADGAGMEDSNEKREETNSSQTKNERSVDSQNEKAFSSTIGASVNIVEENAMRRVREEAVTSVPSTYKMDPGAIGNVVDPISKAGGRQVTISSLSAFAVSAIPIKQLSEVRSDDCAFLHMCLLFSFSVVSRYTSFPKTKKIENMQTFFVAAH
jgi:hypothetical protein